MHLDQLETLASGLDHPEGVALGPDGALYAGGEAGQIYRVEPGSGGPVGAEEIARTGGFVLGLCLDARGCVYACDMEAGAVLRIDPGSGEIDRFCETAGGVALQLPNWCAFGPDGSLWLTDSGVEDVERREGRLVRIPPGGGDGEPVDIEPLAFPNGLCVTPAGEVCFLESFVPRLSVLRNDGPAVIAELPGVVPDGVAADASGGFVIGCYYPFRLLEVDPAGEVVTLLDDPLGLHMISPTNLAYYGEGLERIALGSLFGWELKGIPAPSPGAPVFYP